MRTCENGGCIREFTVCENLGLLAMGLESFLVWTVALDRLLLLVSPGHYNSWPINLYILIMCPPAVGYSLLVAIVGILSARTDEVNYIIYHYIILFFIYYIIITIFVFLVIFSWRL